MEQSEIIYLSLIILSLLLATVGAFTDNWSSYTGVQIDNSNINATANAHQGLWKSCISGSASINLPNTNVQSDTINANIGNTCVSYDKLPKNLIAIRLLTIVGILLILASIILIFKMSNEHLYFAISSIVGGLILAIACGLWATDKNLVPANEKLGYSYHLVAFASLIATLTGISSKFNVI
jgi:hypothetical protein